MKFTFEKYLSLKKKTKLGESKSNKSIKKHFISEAYGGIGDFGDDGDDDDDVTQSVDFDNDQVSNIDFSTNKTNSKYSIQDKFDRDYIKRQVSNKEFNRIFGNKNIDSIQDKETIDIAKISIFPFSNLKYIMDNVKLDGAKIASLEDFACAKISGNTITMPFVDGMFDQTTMSELFIEYGNNSLGQDDIQKRMDDLLKEAIKGYKDCKITEDEFKEISKNLEQSDSQDISTYRLPVDYIIDDQSIVSLLVSFVSTILPSNNNWYIDNGCRIIPYTIPGCRVGHPIYSSVILDSNSKHSADTIKDARDMILESEDIFVSKNLQYLKIAFYILACMTAPTKAKTAETDTYVKSCVKIRESYCKKNNINSIDQYNNPLTSPKIYFKQYKGQSDGSRWFFDDMAKLKFIVGNAKLVPAISGLGLVKSNTDTNNITSDIEVRKKVLSIENKQSKNHPVKNLFAPKSLQRSGGLISVENKLMDENSNLKHSVLPSTMISRIQQSISDMGKK